MSLVSPASGQPVRGQREQRALGVVQRLGLAGSASHAASACSSPRRARPGRARPPAPSARGQREPVTSPVPRPQRAGNATPEPRAAAGVLGQPGGDLAGAERPPVDLEAGVGLGVLGRLRRARSSRSRKHPELQRVEEPVHRLAVPRRRVEVVAGRRSSGTSRTSSVSRRLRRHAARCVAQRSAGLALDLVDPVDQRRRAMPNSRIHLAAVFSPTPGMWAGCRDGSPRSAAKSGYCPGVRPYFSSTAAGVMRAMSETPLRG